MKMRRFLYGIIHGIVMLSALTAGIARAEDAHNEKFGDITVHKGDDPDGAVAIVFSGRPDDTASTLGTLVPETALTISLDTSRYIKGIEDAAKGETCDYLAGEIERLGQSIQNTQSLPFYKQPWLIGVGRGASLAYVIYAEHPDAFAGLAVWGVSDSLSVGAPLCKGDDVQPAFDPAKKELHFAVRNDLPGHVISVRPGGQLQGPLPERQAWLKALREIAEEGAEAGSASALGLPVIELRATAPSASSALIVFLSGDGGWAAIDKELGKYLASRGIDVIGFDTLKFFWSAKTPEEMVKAMTRLIAHYRAEWGKDEVVLLGFSLGAEHIPFVLTGLKPVIRDLIPRAIMLSPGKDTDFEVHISDWLGLDADDGKYQVVPELKKIEKVKLTCIYGVEDEDDSACMGLAAPVITKAFPGGHHFNGDYKAVGEYIISILRDDGLVH